MKECQYKQHCYWQDKSWDHVMANQQKSENCGYCHHYAPSEAEPDKLLETMANSEYWYNLAKSRDVALAALTIRSQQADKALVDIAARIKQVSAMSDRWKRAALKRTKKIKVLEAKLENYRYWQGHAARCSYLYHKSEAKLRRAGRRIKELRDELKA